MEGGEAAAGVVVEEEAAEAEAEAVPSQSSVALSDPPKGEPLLS